MVFSRYGDAATGPTSPGTWTPAAALKTVTSRARRRRTWKLRSGSQGTITLTAAGQPCHAARAIVIRVLGAKAWG